MSQRIGSSREKFSTRLRQPLSFTAPVKLIVLESAGGGRIGFDAQDSWFFSACRSSWKIGKAEEGWGSQAPFANRSAWLQTPY